MLLQDFAPGMKARYQVLPVLALLVAYAARKSRNRGKSPGRKKTLRTRSLELGAAALQPLTPVEQINAYLSGFHFQNGNLDHQIEAHHYCTLLNEELMQCVIYDSPRAEAKLIGIEYIISRRLFESLPEEEKPLWHSHSYEVKSGQLVAPGLPEFVERQFMEKIQTTYGKIWHTWDTTDPEKTLPLGIPNLMMGFTADGQIKPELLAQRDRLLNCSTAAKRQQRKDIETASIAAGANAWEQGEIRQVELVRTGLTYRHAGSRD